MTKRLLSFLIASVLLISCLSISAFALTVDEYGDNFDSTHQDNGCCQVGSDIHYNQGYEDGLLDGAPSQEEIDSYKQEAIDSYLKSDEYLTDLANSLTSAYDDGKSAMQSELQTQLDEQYQDGFNGGYEAEYQGAYDEAETKVYNKGVADGKAEFRGGEEYKKTLQAYLDSGYELGYTEGHADGYDVGMENSIDPTTLFAILFSIIGIVIALLASSYFMNKKKRKESRC